MMLAPKKPQIPRPQPGVRRRARSEQQGHHAKQKGPPAADGVGDNAGRDLEDHLSHGEHGVHDHDFEEAEPAVPDQEDGVDGPDKRRGQVEKIVWTPTYPMTTRRDVYVSGPFIASPAKPKVSPAWPWLYIPARLPGQSVRPGGGGDSGRTLEPVRRLGTTAKGSARRRWSSSSRGTKQARGDLQTRCGNCVDDYRSLRMSAPRRAKWPSGDARGFAFVWMPEVYLRAHRGVLAGS